MSVFTERNTLGESDLLGLRISAGLLACVGGVVALYPFLFAALLIVSAIGLLNGRGSTSIHSMWLLLGALCASIAITYLLFRSSRALREGKRWAAYVAIAFGVVFLLLTSGFIYDLYHPEHASPDEGFGIFIVPALCVVGLWWCVYLNLPHVRRLLNARAH